MPKNKTYYFETVIGEFGVNAKTKKSALEIITMAVVELMSVQKEHDTAVAMIQKKWGIFTPEQGKEIDKLAH